ncbi:CBS domain-containing protein [Phaeacidiphilus oryzae]|uniref:CBS domain-containing protein n=1 Tax=Phaeacidiphilus oryzae TaxID=348818 RepID=UPI00068E19DC|nr:CBS domain-containing protein [Phaeacidiphilus oryzae]
MTRHRTVGDVMTHEVVTARIDTPFKEIAELLARNDVSAVPVVDDQGRPVGLVSEADLLRKEVAKADPEGHLPPVRMAAHLRARAEGDEAGEVMSRPVFTARPEWNIVQATRELVRRGVKRLVVVDEAGRMVGVVSRADLLRIFLRTDTGIREEIVREVLGETLFLSQEQVAVQVAEGVVTLRGEVQEKSTVGIVERLVRAVDGVVAVHNLIEFEFDDSKADLGQSAIHGVLGHQPRGHRTEEAQS